MNGLNDCITFLPVARVGSPSPASNSGGAVQPGRILPVCTWSQSSRSAGNAVDHDSKTSFHSCSSATPRSVSDMCSETAGSMSKVLSGSKPMTSFVARTSSSPSGEPCDFDVSTACGAG